MSMPWWCRKSALWGRAVVALLTAGGRTLSEIPSHIGPCEFGMLGKLVTVRCPKEFAHILRRAGAHVGAWVAALAGAAAPYPGR